VSAIDFETVEALTFDCYGTLIDWESGILAALRPILDVRDVVEPDEHLLELFGELEAEAESGDFLPYRAVLSEVARGIGVQLGFETTEEESADFAGSVVRWPPFADSPEALAALSSRYRLAIVSNVDDDLFAGSQAQLGISFDEVVTAQQVGSYKPNPGHFHEVLRRLDLPTEKVLHVAQSLYHDIGPARHLGLKCVWVNRRAGKGGAGATKPSPAIPDMEVPDLATLVEAIEL
jgi:2-haloacid dehalogenase